MTPTVTTARKSGPLSSVHFSRTAVLLTLIALSLAALTLCYVLPREPFHSVEGLDYGFGPQITSLVRLHRFGVQEPTYWAYAERMPFIPLFLSLLYVTVSRFGVIFIIKNLLCACLLARAGYLLVLRGMLTRWQAIAFLCALYAIPANIICITQIEVEEAYIFFFLVLLLVILLTRNHDEQITSALLISVLYLTKSSDGLLCGIAALWIIWQDRKSPAHRLRSCLPLLLLALSVVGWGTYIRSRTGVFAVGTQASSWNGWNLYKGNNARTAALYPRIHLDQLDDANGLEPPASVLLKNEWDRHFWQLQQGREFIAAHPREVFQLDLRKFAVMAYDIGETPQAIPGKNRPLFVLCLIADHLIFALAIAVVFYRRDWQSALFASLAAAYLLPFFAGFVYHRHMIPVYGMAMAFLACSVGPIRSMAHSVFRTGKSPSTLT